MSKMKIALFALIGLLVAVGAGWIWGSWGRWAAERQAQGAELRVQLAEARAGLLGGVGQACGRHIAQHHDVVLEELGRAGAARPKTSPRIQY